MAFFFFEDQLKELVISLQGKQHNSTFSSKSDFMQVFKLCPFSFRFSDKWKMSRSEVNRIPKKWEVFPGRNTILCNGRILMAQRAGLFHLCVILILLTRQVIFIRYWYQCLSLLSIFSVVYFLHLTAPTCQNM